MPETTFWKVILLFLFTISTAGCSFWATDKVDDFSYLQGKHILTVIEKLNRNPDVIEDWSDYKRYTWQHCELTGQSIMARRDDGSYYLKPEYSCCNLVFEVNRNNKIMAYQNLDSCSLGNDLKLAAKK